MKGQNKMEDKNNSMFFNCYKTDGLTNREKEVLELLIKGNSNVKIAEILHISYYTSKAHVSSILKKLNVKDRVCAAVKAVEEHLI